jgi:hypothetical protein
MAAQEHLSGQLSMFVPARELMGYTAGHTEGYGDKYLFLSESPGLIKEKLQESKSGSSSGSYLPKKKGQESLYDSIKKEGVKSPISLRVRKNGVQISDGHHRVVAAHDINPDMEVPVRYA